jgi:hypothetical protein
VQSGGKAQLGTRCKSPTMQSGVCAFLQPLAFEFLLLTLFNCSDVIENVAVAIPVVTSCTTSC